MRLALALLSTLAAPALAAPAQAAITPSRNASAVASAITEQLPPGAFGGRAAFTTIRPATNPEGQAANPAAIGDDAPPLAGFPTSTAQYAILSTGDSTFGDDPNDNTRTGVPNGDGSEDLGHGQGVHDLITLRIDFSVPLGSSCLRLDVRFLSEEFPEFVDQDVNDAFLAELDESTFTADGGGPVTAPNNFAFDGDGSLVSVDTTAFAAEEAAGTTYDGATPRLRASTPVTPGDHRIFLSVFDQGDDVLDSTAFIDAMRLDSASGEACRRGATADTTAPAVTVSSPADGSTVGAPPIFAGSAGDAAGDAGTVDVRVLSGSQVVRQLTAARSGTSWSVQGDLPAPGVYTVQAQQSDAAGNVGSATSTFTVPEPPLIIEPLPPPVTGKAVNVYPVKGIVTVKVPGGRTVRLEEAEHIPTGSVVDTRKGTVRLMSTGARETIQRALFFQGLFKVTQTKGPRPLTVLRLTEKLTRCTAGRSEATASAKRRKRRLWGNGSGAFRTSGRRSAATVSGTKWLVEDSCAGTLTKVARGKVKVRDYKKRKTITVRAGHSYRAR